MKTFTYKEIGFVCGLQEEQALIPFPLKACFGPGLTNARKSAQSLIRENPKALVSIGFAGGLNPWLKPGYLIIPTHVIDQNQQKILCDTQLILNFNAKLSQLNPLNLEIISLNQPALTLQEKSNLAKIADAIDMESTAIANVAQENNIPFAAIRIILDSATHAIPPAAMALTPNGSPNIPQIIINLIKNPNQIIPTFKLIKPHHQASNTLRLISKLLND